MVKQIPEETAAATPIEADALAIDSVRPLPRVSIQAFCESEAVLACLEAASKDRRVAKANFKVLTGGFRAALEHFASAPTPNLVVIETLMEPPALLAALDQLAEVCDPGSKVIVVGHYNDIHLYRELMRCGISEYLVGPITMADILGTISHVFTSEDSEPLGRSIAFIGARGGVGSSTIAHNTAWTISNLFQTESILVDLDLPFGTANIDFDRDPPQGLFEALSSFEEMDETLLDRLLVKCADRLSLLAAPSMLDRPYEFGAQAYRTVIETAQRTAPIVALDMPHLWTDWTREILASVDRVVLTATPDLSNLRNAKNLVETLRKLRPNDGQPILVLNQLAIAKRPEIGIEEFCEPLDLRPAVEIGFDPQLFGEAANAGRMIGQNAPKSEIVAAFEDLAHAATGRGVPKPKKATGLLGRLRLKRAAA